MDLALRKSYRGQLTKLINAANIVIADSDVSFDDIAVLVERIKAVNVSLKELNGKLAPTFQEDQFEAECEKIVEYDLSATEATVRLERKLKTAIHTHGELHQDLDEAMSASGSNENNQNDEITEGITGNNQVNMQQTMVRLPKLDIIKFNGEIARWPEFWEQYNTVIHENKCLDNIAKFAYLKSFLTGKAAITISGLTSSQQSYNDAIDLLKAEYACNERIIDTYIQRLLSISCIKSERDTYALRKLFNTASTITKSLSTLGISADQYGLLVKSIVYKALPYNMRVAYQKQKINSSDSNDNASVSGASNASADSNNLDYEQQISGLLQFIKVEIDSIEQASCARDADSQKPKDGNNFGNNGQFNRHWKPRGSETFTAAGLLTSARDCCLFCKSKSHETTNCNGSLTITAKKNILKENKLCFRCTKPNHNSKFCRTSNLCCAKCKKRHVTSMCEPWNDNAANHSEPKSGGSHSSNAERNNSTVLVANSIVHNIYLQTACAFILSNNDKEKTLIRLIVDGGSQLSFIREDVSRELALPVIGTHRIAIQSFGQSKMAPARLCNRVKLKVKSQYSNNIVELSAVEVPEICFDTLQPPSQADPVINEFSVEHYLADLVKGDQSPNHGFSLLIGADNYWKIVSRETVKLTNSLTAVNTTFGWTILGASDSDVNTDNNCFVNFNVSTVLHTHVQLPDENELDLNKFWDLETIGINASETTVLDNFTDNFIQNNVTFKNDRYQVTLPWQNDKIIDSNFTGALVRVKGLVNKLSKNGTLTEYDNAVREYVRSGCAEEVVNNGGTFNEPAYYMPHRPVYRNDKETTKLRVVFDASAHAPGTPSLNEKLLAGENLVPNLLKIFINFRLGAIALIADIEKAFLQIELCEEDRDYHRFLWFKEPVNPNITSMTQLPDFTTFRMTRVTFGVTTSPFLLAATLRKHLLEHPERDVAATLVESFYVDDLAVAVSSTSEALQLYEKANIILSSANMNLRKWCSNDHVVMQRINEENETSPVEIPFNNSKKVLGIIWHTVSDELKFDLTSIENTNNCNLTTKRNVLQTVAKIFDPIGVLGPVTVKAKIILQNIWKRKLDWDDTLPDDLAKEWIKWRQELPLLSDFSIDRCLIENPTDEVELHIFADASPHAYGCVAYLKGLTTGNTKFVMSKNRVAPLNKQEDNALTLPILELTAALCAARLQKYLLENVTLNLKDTVLWSDSKIALYWIKGKRATKWKPYVQNRVTEIRNIHTGSWRYCPGKQNPADLVTRGVNSSKHLLESTLWLQGPSWLQLERENWPEDEFLEETATTSLFIEVQEKLPLKISPIFDLERYSNLERLLRITAYVRRFCRNIDKRKGKLSGPLTTTEINEADNYWIRIVQYEAFGKEISDLSSGKPLSNQSRILLLIPFIDKENVLRLGGRLQETCLTEEEKHPAILPKQSILTERIIWKAHEETLHSGVNSTLALTRKKFWIIQGRQRIKSIISRCVKCKRLKGKPGNEPFAPLPKDRVTFAHPFEVTGVDFAGPLYITSDSGQRVKTYIMLLTCAAIRAVHLELVPDLTTESCIRALRRFIARRGVPKVIYSDNAKTFKRAAEELYILTNILKHDEVQGLAQKQRIKWKFIVERASWWGGFWERLVRTVKSGLKATLGRKVIKYDELQTVLTEVEATVNSRPLTYIDDDPTNLMILSPIKFLIGSTDSGFSMDLKVPEIKRNDILKQWRYREKLGTDFWRRWTQDYLQQLRSAHYLKTPKSIRFKVGDVLLLHDQSRPRLMWKLVRVTNCFQGRDGRTRACEVRTSDGTLLRRPIQLLYPLEIDQFPPGEDVENPVPKTSDEADVISYGNQ